MESIFDTTDVFNQDISSWNTSNVTNMELMFAFAISFNQDLSECGVTNIISEPSDFATNSILVP